MATGQLECELDHDFTKTSESCARRLGQFHSGRDGRWLLGGMGVDIRDNLAGRV